VGRQDYPQGLDAIQDTAFKCQRINMPFSHGSDVPYVPQG